MRVSVVLIVYSGSSTSDLVHVIEEVEAQTYDPIETVVVTSDAPEIADVIRGMDVTLVELDCDDGLSDARNVGAEHASGDIVAFTDEDVVLQPSWVRSLVDVYEKYEAFGVGGPAFPIWPGEPPRSLPPEYYWLIGSDYDVPMSITETRNSFGCNISFDRDAFIDAGGFDEALGKNPDAPLQGEEAQLTGRLYDVTDGSFYVTPDAVIGHMVYESQLDVRQWHRRAFWQGYSKAFLETEMSDEGDFLRRIVTDATWSRIPPRSASDVMQLVLLYTLTAAVGFGFLRATLHSK